MKLLHFTAEWCGPCKMMKPVIDEIVSERSDLEYIPIDIDTNQETAVDYGIMSVPTFVLLDEDDSILASVVGAMPKKQFLTSIGL